MDELMQAVSDLRGDIKTEDDGGIYFVKDTYIYKRMFGGSYFAGAIATTKQFLIVVQQLSEASWINGQSVEEWLRDMKGGVEMLTDKGGNQYQKGAIYEFSDCGILWSCCVLASIQDASKGYVDGFGFPWHLCRETSAVIGTITKAPLVLEDGAAYQFDLYDGSITANGIYSADRNLFNVSRTDFVSKNDAINIIKLVPESK